MSIFDVAESSWWARSLYSLMRLDASYPDSTAVTAEEVGLLASLFVGAALAVGLCWTSLRSLVFKGNLAAAAPVVLIAAAGFWGKVQVQTNFGAYDLAPRVIETVPEVHNATHATFRTDYFGLPVVGRAIIPADMLARWTPSALAHAYANSSAAVQLGNVEQTDVGYATYSLHDFFSGMEDEHWVASVRAKDGSVPYLAEENNILRQGVNGSDYMKAVSDIFSATLLSKEDRESFHFTDVWLWSGPANARTGLHTDWDPTNLLHQLYGEKTVWVIHPGDTPKCYPSEKYDLGATIARVDPFNPDLEAFPEYANARILEVKLRPGDALQIPAGWMHYAKCDTACVSLSGRSFNLPQTVATLPSVGLAVLHRFGLYGGASTSGYVYQEGEGETDTWNNIFERVKNVSWYVPGEEYH
ncbi:JmjC domain-containing protein D [Diplonema papillatum]|nr:JmjC domain-containing protein D [Diplonema papillatum]